MDFGGFRRMMEVEEGGGGEEEGGGGRGMAVRRDRQIGE